MRINRATQCHDSERLPIDELSGYAGRLSVDTLVAGARTFENSITVVGRIEPMQLGSIELRDHALQSAGLGKSVARPRQKQHGLPERRQMLGAGGRGFACRMQGERAKDQTRGREPCIEDRMRSHAATEGMSAEPDRARAALSCRGHGLCDAAGHDGPCIDTPTALADKRKVEAQRSDTHALESIGERLHMTMRHAGTRAMREHQSRDSSVGALPDLVVNCGSAHPRQRSR